MEINEARLVRFALLGLFLGMTGLIIFTFFLPPSLALPSWIGAAQFSFNRGMVLNISQDPHVPWLYHYTIARTELHYCTGFRFPELKENASLLYWWRNLSSACFLYEVKVLSLP